MTKYNNKDEIFGLYHTLIKQTERKNYKIITKRETKGFTFA